MPPPDSNRTLSDDDKRILDAWIEQRAPYAEHWAFTTPQPTSPPTDLFEHLANRDGWDRQTRARWSENPVDVFVASRLVQEDLFPSPEADPETLLRRVALTLTGLLPPESLQERSTTRIQARTCIARACTRTGSGQ